MSSRSKNSTGGRTLRQKAEEYLDGKCHEMVKPETKIEVKTLLHELQIYQIELEMQNEELRQANETAELAVKKNTMLFDFAPMGYFTLDTEGLICDLNFTGAEILGEKRFSLINTKFELFVSNESSAVFEDFLRMVFERKTTESCKVMMGIDQKNLHPVYLEGVVIDDKRECLLSAIDISKFKE
ncbi:hypothetical protein [Gaoshiqia sp. Z1-71]|uniref:hypothetical protein n=1 Tax=Gaoshiqia hydrogeniformans TaxID=3290090 RepID=UPI003BF7D903